MLKKTLTMLVLCGLLLGGLARSADIYEIDIDLDPGLNNAASYTENGGPPSSPPKDFTIIDSGDEVHISNFHATDDKTAEADKLTVGNGGTLHIGYDSSLTDSTSGMTIDLKTASGAKRDFTVGDETGSGTVIIGQSTGTEDITITGRKLNIVDGSVTVNSGTGDTSLEFEEFELAKGNFTMSGSDASLTIGAAGTGTAIIGDGESVNSNAIFTASGTADSASDHGAKFLRGLQITMGGTLTGEAGSDATVYLGATGGLRLTGGTLLNDTAGDLTLTGGNSLTIYIEGDHKSTIETTVGAGDILFRSGTILNVRQDLDIIMAQLSVAQYTQTAGNVVITNGGSLTVSGTAAMSGSGSSFAGTGVFLSGLAVTKGATLGGSEITAITTDTGKTLTIDKDSFLDISASDVILGADTAAGLSGTIQVGSGELNVTDTSASVTLDANTSFRVIGTASVGDIVIRAANTSSVIDFDLANKVDDQFLLGEYRFEQDAGGNVFVSDAVAGELLDGTDFARVKGRIIKKYGPSVNTGGFIENIYKSVSNTSTGPLAKLEPDTRIVTGDGSSLEKSYLMNQKNFEAFATNDPAARDGSLAAMYTGLNNSGVAEIAITTSNQLLSRVQAHVRRNSALRASLRESGCDDGTAAAALNAGQLNHVWLGGFGLWENADENKGLDGYRYNAGGFIGGYDRAYGPVTVGGAFAYARGGFSDKTALDHDSTISSYSLALHGTFNHATGFYATAAAGYTYSKNDINELRSDASSSSGRSWNRANYHGDTLNIGLEIGCDIQPMDGLTITPSAGLTYLHTWLEDHDEILGNAVAGHIRGVKNHTTRIPVRVDIGYAVATGDESSLRLNAGGGYIYNSNIDGITGAFRPYGFSNAYDHRVRGRESNRHFLNLSAGAQFITGPVDVAVNYDYAASAKTKIHRLTGSVGISF